MGAGFVRRIPTSTIVLRVLLTWQSAGLSRCLSVRPDAAAWRADPHRTANDDSDRDRSSCRPLSLRTSTELLAGVQSEPARGRGTAHFAEVESEGLTPPLGGRAVGHEGGEAGHVGVGVG